VDQALAKDHPGNYIDTPLYYLIEQYQYFISFSLYETSLETKGTLPIDFAMATEMGFVLIVHHEICYNSPFVLVCVDCSNGVACDD